MTFREWRKSVGLTQLQAAERMGVAQSRISAIENDPREATRAFIERAFEVSGGAVPVEIWFPDAAIPKPPEGGEPLRKAS